MVPLKHLSTWYCSATTDQRIASINDGSTKSWWHPDMKSALSTSPAFGSKFGQSFSHRVFICSLSEISRGKILPAHGAQLGRFYLESDWFQQPAVASCQSKVFSRVIYGRLLHPRFMDHDPGTVETASFIFWMAIELIGVKLAWKWSKQFLPSFLWFPLKFISVFCQNNGNRVSLTPALTIA